MTKNAKIAVVVSILAVITLLVVVSSTIFALESARVIWYNTPSSALASISSETMLENTGVRGQSVFVLDKKRAKENLEKKYPKMRVIDLEVAWPNIVNIHAIERQQVYAIKLSETKFAIVDEYFKILELKSTFSSTQTNEILTEIKDLEDKNYKLGDTISFAHTNTFVGMYNAFTELSRNLTDMKALFSSISYTNSKVTISTHFGVTIVLDNPTKNTSAKTRMAIKTFDLLATEDYGHGTIEVFVNSEDTLESRYY